MLLINLDVDDEQLKNAYLNMLNRKEIAIIAVASNCATRIQSTIAATKRILPAVLEIPTKECPYNIDEDKLALRAAVRFVHLI